MHGIQDPIQPFSIVLVVFFIIVITVGRQSQQSLPLITSFPTSWPVQIFLPALSAPSTGLSVIICTQPYQLSPARFGHPFIVVLPGSGSPLPDAISTGRCGCSSRRFYQPLPLPQVLLQRKRSKAIFQPHRVSGCCSLRPGMSIGERFDSQQPPVGKRAKMAMRLVPRSSVKAVRPSAIEIRIITTMSLLKATTFI